MKCAIEGCKVSAGLLIPLEVSDGSKPHPHKRKEDLPLCFDHYGAIADYFYLTFLGPTPPPAKVLEESSTLNSTKRH